MGPEDARLVVQLLLIGTHSARGQRYVKVGRHFWESILVMARESHRCIEGSRFDSLWIQKGLQSVFIIRLQGWIVEVSLFESEGERCTHLLHIVT